MLICISGKPVSFHAHGLRTHAAQLRAEGVDIGIISKQLGHSSIATTARYLDHIAPRDVIERMRERVWAAQLIVGIADTTNAPRDVGTTAAHR